MSDALEEQFDRTTVGYGTVNWITITSRTVSSKAIIYRNVNKRTFSCKTAK